MRAPLPSLLLVLAAAVLCAAAPAPAVRDQTTLARFADAGPRLSEVLAEVARRPTFAERIVDASERFLGVRYQFDPLGEGPGGGADEDPLLRFDLADCQTYVETVLAVAQARSEDEVRRVLDDIRYDGAIGYERRNHFFEAQWLAANTRKGYVRDATAAIAGADAVTHRKQVTAEQWEARTFGRDIALPADRIPVGALSISYLPLGKVMKHAREIPSGTVAVVIREDKPLAPTMVSHLGFVIQTERGPVMRHAARDRYGRVVDEPLDAFVARHGKFKKWKVLGLQLLRPLEPKK